MHQIFPPTILSATHISCPKCHWQGKGEEVEQEALILTDAIELYCPSCHGYLGFISEPEPENQ